MTARAAARLRGFAPGLVVVGLIAAGFYFYGLGAGGTFYFKLVKAPFAPAIDAPYYRASILHVALAHWLGLGASILGFRLAVLSCLWAAWGYLALVIRRRLSVGDTCLVLVVLMCHPSAMIAYTWTCHPDALTYLLGAILMFSRRPWVVAVVAVLGAWTHLAMWGVVCINAVILWLGFAEPRARARAVAAGVGLVVGAGSCALALHLCGIEIARGRLALGMANELDVLLGYWTRVGWPVFYSLHFAHLLWLPALLVTLHRSRRAGAFALLLTQALALTAAFFTQDTTRVFGFLAWGPLVYCLVYALSEERGAGGRRYLRPLIGVAVIITLVAPKVFAWKGDLRDTEGARAQLRALLF